jgi:hypothetical protein
MLDKPSAEGGSIGYEKTCKQCMCSFCDAEMITSQESLLLWRKPMFVQQSTVGSNTREDYQIISNSFLENIHIEFSLCIKLISLIQVCLIKTYR